MYVLLQFLTVLSPAAGSRFRNTSIMLRLNFSEPLSLQKYRFLGADSFRTQAPNTTIVFDVHRDGNFSLELLAVDLAGNVQSRPTVVSWTTDTSNFFFYFFY